LTLTKYAYDGTIFDGELIAEKKLFLMYDAVMVGGKFVGNEKLMDRLLEAEPIVTTAVKFCTHLTLRMKEFFSLKEIQELVMVRVFVKREATFGRARPKAASTSRG